MPLDLGAPMKRRPDSPESDSAPRKTQRMEASSNGVLFKVSEPSVLVTSEPSTITTVVNSAVVEGSETSNQRKEEDNSSCTSTSTSGGNYVHKLKKAWIQSYVCEPTAGASSSNPPSARATPSPALSTSSSKKNEATSRSSNGLKNNNNDDTSTSTSESEDSRAPIRKELGKPGPKGRSVAPPRKKRDSENSEESEGKDSDATSSSRKSSVTSKSEGKKRGRKPKRDKDEPKEKKKHSDGFSNGRPSNPFQKPPVSQLKRTQESFLQDASCFEVAPKLNKCRECRWTQSQRNKKMPNIFCRFYAFRRLRYTKNGQLSVVGFCDPNEDARPEDIDVWTAKKVAPSSKREELSSEQAVFLVNNLMDDFDLIMAQEREALEVHLGKGEHVNTVNHNRLSSSIQT